MPKDFSLMTPTARKRLPVRFKPYFKPLQEGLHIGYRKGERDRVWIGRVRVEADGGKEYRTEHLAPADDEPGIPDSLDYAEAAALVRDWGGKTIDSARREAQGEQPKPKGPFVVRTASDEYLEDYKRRGGRGLRTIQSHINLHILPALGDIEVRDLTKQRIDRWAAKIAESPRHRRTAKMATKRNLGETPKTQNEIRQRKSTTNGIRTTLIAILNYAFREGRVDSDIEWRKSKPFKKVGSARIRYLTVEESQRLINACPADLRAIATGALLTGCRYGELCRLVAGDFNSEAGTLFIEFSKSGKPRNVYLNDEGLAFFRDATAGKAKHDLIFKKSDGTAWSETHQFRPLREACKKAKIVPAINFHVTRHTFASQLAMQGVPLQVIAQALGHADSRICEAHYAHLAPSYVAQTIRQSLPKLGIVPASNVESMPARGRN